MSEPQRLDYASPEDIETRRFRAWSRLGLVSLVASYALPVLYGLGVTIAMLINPERLDDPSHRSMFANTLLEAGICLLPPIPIVLLIAAVACYKTRSSGQSIALLVWFPVAVALMTSISLLNW